MTFEINAIARLRPVEKYDEVDVVRTHRRYDPAVAPLSLMVSWIEDEDT